MFPAPLLQVSSFRNPNSPANNDLPAQMNPPSYRNPEISKPSKFLPQDAREWPIAI